MLRNHDSNQNGDYFINETLPNDAVDINDADSCGINFCLNKEKEKDLYSIVHFNNFSTGLIPASVIPPEEKDNLFGTLPVSYINVNR